MSLQFIFGGSGSGKSTFSYESVLKQAAENPRKNFLVLVPEQFTMQTQRELVQRQKAHAIMNVDVLSFARLAYRVLDELGRQNLVILEETGKNLVLRKIAEEKKKELKVLGKSMNKMGYVSEVKSLISELSQYNVTPQLLEQFLHTADISEALRLKMQDILTMYQGYREYLEGRFITSEEVLTLLHDVAEKSAILRGSVIVFDEFTGFTPVQNKLIRKLMALADKIIVSVTMDERENFYHSRGQQELFAMSKKTTGALLAIAEKLHIPIEEPVVLSGAGEKRYQNAPSLYFMEQNLFRPGRREWKGETDEIQIVAMKNPREELHFAAREIAQLVRENGYCYKDIAIVTGDISLYANYVPEIFELYDVPFFIDQTKTILFHPLIEFIRAVLEVLEYDFSYESVFRFLRCGLHDLENEEIDRLENYVLAKGIRGRKAWRKKWTFVLPDGTKDDMTEMNAVRERIYGLLEPLYQAFHAKNATIREETAALYQLFLDFKIEKKMKEKETAYEAAGNQAKAKEYSQIYKIMIDLLDKVVALLGDEKISLKEYGDILDAGFDAARVGIIPPGNDKVTIGDIERTRLNHIKVLFFLGVNDGIVPKAGNAGGIISQFERERMAECNLELAPSARERVFIQKFYLYLNMTKPSDFLYVTFSKVNSEGKALRSSYLIGTLRKLFPKKQVSVIEEETRDCVVTPKSSLPFFIRGLAETGENAKALHNANTFHSSNALWNVNALWSAKALHNALGKWYLSKEEYREEIGRLIDAAYDIHTDEPISHAVTKALYGSVLMNSVTRLERFACCAFSHFLSYGLRLKERDLLQFSGVDMGNLYHDALELFSKRIEASDYTWFDIPEKTKEVFIEESMEEAVAESKSASVFENARNRYLLERLKSTVRCTVWALVVQVQKGRFLPSDFEITFTGADSLDAVRFSLSEEEKMHLFGRIDRIDTYETENKIYVKVIDYKSGNTSFSLLNFYYGLQLQLVVYLNAAMELAEKKNPGKRAEPAGMFYYHVKNPMVDGTGAESEEEVRKAIFEQLKLNGLVNSDEKIYRAMDSDFSGNSTVIPVGLKSDGSLKAASKVADTHEFRAMSKYVNEKIDEAGKRIFAGDISARPYKLSDQTGCDYCPYHSVCCFDPRIPGFLYEKLEPFEDSKEILEKIRKEVETDGNDVDKGSAEGYTS